MYFFALSRVLTLYALGSFLGLVKAHLGYGQQARPLVTVAQWNLLDYTFPWDNTVNMFRPENVVPTGLEIGWRRLFIATPRLYSGVPATLSTIPRNIPEGSSPALQPYPDWSFHSAGRGDLANCTGLVSVYRIRMDSCDRLWVLDSGVMTSLEDFQTVCPPKILIFDTNTDRVVRIISFPRQVLRPASLLTNIIIDETTTGGRCDDAFVYMSDTAAPALVVYDAGRDLSWRVTHPAMYPDPDFGTYNILGDRFTLMDGVVGITFSPKSRLVYFQPLATDRLFAISTASLRAGPPASVADELPVKLVGRKASQGLGIAVDPNDDTVYLSTMTETALATWNPYTNQNGVIAYDPTRLQFTADLRLPDRDPGALWAVTSRFQKFFLKTVSNQEVNLRIVRLQLQTSSGQGVFQREARGSPEANLLRPADLSSDLTETKSTSLFNSTIVY